MTAAPTGAHQTVRASRNNARARAWGTALSDYRQYLIAVGRAPKTRRLRMGYAGMFADTATKMPHRTKVDDLHQFLAANPQWSPSTRRVVIASLRDFFGWMQKTERRPDNPALALPSVRVPQRPPRPCPDAVLAEVLATADERTKLMIEAAAFCGLRRSEIAGLHSGSLTRTPEGWAVSITGKGGKERTVPVSDDMATAISARRGWTFPGQQPGQHLCPEIVGRLVADALPLGWTCHTLRHRFASAAYRADRDIRAVQELLGHSSVATTQIYTAVPDDARRRAATAAQVITPAAEYVEPEGARR